MGTAEVGLIVAVVAAVVVIVQAFVSYRHSRNHRRELTVNATRPRFLRLDEGRFDFEVTNSGTLDETIVECGVWSPRGGRLAACLWTTGIRMRACRYKQRVTGVKLALNETATLDGIPIEALEGLWPDSLGRQARAYVKTARGDVYQGPRLAPDALNGPLEIAFASAEAKLASRH